MINTWINETENDIEELQITQEDITERIPLRNKFKVFQEKPRRKTGAVWTGEGSHGTVLIQFISTSFHNNQEVQ